MAGFVMPTPSRPPGPRPTVKGGLVPVFALVAALAAGGAACWYYGPQISDQAKQAAITATDHLKNKFFPARNTAPDIRPGPEAIADTYLNKVAPEYAIIDGRKWQPSQDDAEKVRKLIIQYETMPFEAEDALTYYYGDYLTPELRAALKDSIELYKKTLHDPVEVAAAAVRDLQVFIQTQQNAATLAPSLTSTVEISIRNRKYNDLYGPMSYEQAAELAPRYVVRRNTAVSADQIDNIRRNMTRLDYETDRMDAWHKKGFIGYWIVRGETIKLARDPANHKLQIPASLAKPGIQP